MQPTLSRHLIDVMMPLVFAVLVFAPPLAAEVLEFVEVELDDPNGTQRLTQAQTVAVSSDGRHVYVGNASVADPAVVVFARDPNTGALSFVEALFDGQPDSFDPNEPIQALNRPQGIAVSPNGQRVYVAITNVDDAVAVFARDPNTGRLDWLESEEDPQFEPRHDGAHAVMVSPDNRHVYVAGRTDDTVAAFSTDPNTGLIFIAVVVDDGVDPNAGVPGLNGAGSLAQDPNGRRIYVSGSSTAASDDALVIFDRDPNSGELSFRSTLFDDGVDPNAGFPGLNRPSSLAVSPDGAHLYVAGNSDAAVVVFARDPNGLTWVETIFDDGVDPNDPGVDPNNLAPGLQEIIAVAASPGGTRIFAVSNFQDDALIVFQRDAGTGRLTLAQTLFKAELPGAQADALGSPTSLAVSPDGAYVYVTSTVPGSVAVFRVALCGNGDPADPAEQCDDGNLIEGDGCDTNCTLTACGNGIETAGEECDDGNTVSEDGCSAACLDEFCGDGVTQAGLGEDCDEGNTLSCDGDGCSFDCQSEPNNGCGDGVQNTSCEECDDGNTEDCDGCSGACVSEPPQVCGDGIINLCTEACDTGNANSCDEDQCSATCEAELGNRCGDGIVLTGCGEACDKGNTLSCDGDGCSASCQFQVGNGCGDGILNASCEDCDEGVGNSDDPNASCRTDCTPRRCGDGIIDGDEECDVDEDCSGEESCDSSCLCIADVCGDGVVEGNEECDDGNTLDGDGCTADCKDEFCGDGVVNDAPNEACDDGNDDSGDCCGSSCAVEEFCECAGGEPSECDGICGDGMVRGNEQCDDGDENSCDGCSFPGCDLEVGYECMDGIVNAACGEGCDDGNSDPNDGCNNSCLIEGCGDGEVDLIGVLIPEECDHEIVGGSVPGCDVSCQLDEAGEKCQKAVAKRGLKYANRIHKALERCRTRLLAGKRVLKPDDTPVENVLECDQEAKAAGKILAAGVKLRTKIAAKCPGDLIAPLQLCASDLDGLVSADGAEGCLIEAHQFAVNLMLNEQYPPDLCVCEPDCALAGEFCQCVIALDCTGSGACVEVPDSCAGEDPNAPVVCGCDGVTYDNACEAAKQQTSVAAEDACPL